MKQFHLFLALYGIFFFMSCGTTQFVSNRQPQEIDKILLLKPLTKISIIGKNNKAVYNDIYSHEMMMDIVESIEKKLPPRIAKQRLVTDDSTQNALDQEIYYLVSRVEQSHTITGIQLSDNMVALLEKNGQNYAIGAFGSGFTREKGGYGKEIAKGIGIGILTLGLVVPVPVKANSTIICFILDKQKRNIAFYQSNIGQDREPINKDVIQAQIEKLLHGYFKPAAHTNY